MTMYDDSRVVTLLREIDPPAAPVDRLGRVRSRARRGESRRAAALAAAMAVVLAAGLVSAISLGHRDGNEVLSVAGAARATTATGSARVTIEATITSSSLPNVPSGPLMKLTGLIDFRHNAFDVTGTLGGQALGTAGSVEERGIGADRWSKQSNPFGADGKPWVHSVEKPTGVGFAGGAQSADPAKLLDYLESKGTVVSRSTVGDITRTRLRIPADVLGSGTTNGAKVADADVTVDTDGDNLIRSVTSVTDTRGFGTIAMTMRYDDFGVEVDIQPPPADQVQEADAAPTSGSVTGTVHSFPLQPGSPEQKQQACTALRFLENQPMQGTSSDAQKKLQEQMLASLRTACTGAKK
jgi:hypothetical protein